MTFFEELKRRSVVKVAMLYLVTAWLLLQLTDVLSSLLSLPESAGPLIVALLVLGFFPVMIFAWVYEITPGGIKRDEDVDRSQIPPPSTGRKISLVIVVLLFIAIGTVVAPRLIPDTSVETSVATSQTSPATDSVPSDKPSIAVLPFVNMSQDPEQEYFADGMTEDIIHKLTHVRDMRVISRNSAFRYKDTAVDSRQIGAELGVRHLLEGSVRRSADQLRITVALIDSANSEPVWAEQWDQTWTDIFALQDEITARIINELEIELVEGEQRRVTQQATDNPDAYDALRRGTAAFEELPKTRESLLKAKNWFESATELDPQYAAAYAWMAIGLAEEVVHSLSSNPVDTLDEAESWAKRALALNDSLSRTYDTLGWISALRGDVQQAYEYQSKALELAPGNADVLVLIGDTLCLLGRPEEALASVKKGIDLNPYPPWWYSWGVGQAQMFLGNYSESLEATEMSFNMYPGYVHTRVNLIIALMGLGRKEEARAQARELLEANPDYEIRSLRYLNKMSDVEQKLKFFSMLEEAGLQ